MILSHIARYFNTYFVANRARELYFFELYRILEASLLIVFCFSSWGQTTIAIVKPTTIRLAAIIYWCAATSLFLFGPYILKQGILRVFVGFALDLLIATLVLMTTQGFGASITSLLLVNISCVAWILPTAWAYLCAAISACSMTVIFAYFISKQTGLASWVIGGMAGASYLAVTLLLQLLRRRLVETESLVVKREIDLFNLTQLNELIIRRMPTGLLVVDHHNEIQQCNEAAWQQMANNFPVIRDLSITAPALATQLQNWRQQDRYTSTPITLSPDMPPVVPRFTRVASRDHETIIIFLDDPELVSRQAEMITLRSMGKLAASIAHEIRNPLTAIHYSAELLAESTQLKTEDQRLTQIILQHCRRMNGIIENVLHLSKRQHAKPESIELNAWVADFLAEYQQILPLGDDTLTLQAHESPLFVLADRSQLEQVLQNLIQNARQHGHTPNQPAKITIQVTITQKNQTPTIAISDQGPGVSEIQAQKIFDPFFSTDVYGTGLGLYLARELCLANLAQLEYVPLKDSEHGSCFRIIFHNLKNSGSYLSEALTLKT